MRMAVLYAAIAATVAMTPSVRADELFGNWQRDDGNARVRVAACGQAMCAINIWVRDPRGEEKVGDMLVLKVRAAGADRMAGVAHDPQRNLDFNIEMNLKGQRLRTRGCLAGSQLCRDFAWTRVH